MGTRAIIRRIGTTRAVAVDPNNPDRVFIGTFDVMVRDAHGHTSCLTIPPAAILIAEALRITLCTWIITLSRSCLARRAYCCSKEMTVASHGTTNADTDNVHDSIATWFNMDNGLEHDRILRRRHQRQLCQLPRHLWQLEAPRTTDLARSPSPAPRLGLCSMADGT